MKIILTQHAKDKFEAIKKAKVKINMDLLKETLTSPDVVQVDKIDPELTHYIKKIENKYLRVVCKREERYYKVITFFYDRGFLRKLKKEE